jgi:hypothetical protein
VTIADTLHPLEVEAAPLPDVNSVEGDGFEAISRGIVRPARALDIAQAPDAFRVYDYKDVQALLATRRVDARRPFVSIALAMEREGLFRLTGAWRLREDDETRTDALVTDPALAFEAFLDKYGLDYRAGGNVVRFVPVASIDVPGNALSPELLFEALGLTDEDNFGVHVSLEVTEPGIATLRWPFVVATNRYENSER